MSSVDQFCKIPSGIQLCYRTYGDKENEAIVLIAGLGQQLIAWPLKFVEALVEKCFYVVCFDNRDVGRSQRINETPPNTLQKLLGKAPKHGYSLKDMASDVIGLMQHLSIQQAHIAGMSMGGMIAQTVAVNFPQHTLSLTSLFSTTGSKKVGQPTFGSLLRIVSPPAKTKKKSISDFVKLMKYFGPSSYKIDQFELENYASLAWDRNQGLNNESGFSRQIAAIYRSGDRSQELRQIKIPTLIIHGDDDVLVQPSGGIACAELIPNANLKIFSGMGHYLPQAILPEIVNLINELKC